MEGKKRPLLIALIGFITLLVAILILASAALALFSDTLVDFTGLDFGSSIGYGGFIAGFIILIIGLAIWRGWAIAWYIAVLIYGLGVIGSIISIGLIATGGEMVAVTPFAVSLFIGILILYYLFRPKVKEFFGI